MRVFDGVKELGKAVGKHVGHSDWYTVTQDQIDAFAAARATTGGSTSTRRRRPRGPFGSTVADGFLTLSLLPMLTRQVCKVEGVKMGVNYGADKLRLPSPVPVGSRVRDGVELTAVAPNGLGYEVAIRVTIERDVGDMPACVVDMLAVVVP